MSGILGFFDNWRHKALANDSGVHSTLQNDCALRHLVELNSLQEIVFKINASGQWIFLNEKWAEYTGYPTDQSLGKNWLQYIHPKEHELCREYLRRATKPQRNDSSISVRIITQENEFRWVEMRAGLLPDEHSGAPVLIGTLTDISVGKYENEAQLASYRALMSLINNVPGMIYRCRNNRDWTMEFVSGGCSTLTGYGPEHVINNQAAWAELIHPESREYVWKTIQSAVEKQQPYELTYLIVTKDGKEKWIWERGQGNFSENGELLGLEGLITDITDHQRQSLRTAHNSLYDPDTQLATTHLFLDDIQHAIERAKHHPSYTFSILVVHIDQHAGHKIQASSTEKDVLTRDIGQRLRETLGPSATICRLHNYEFGILLEHDLSSNPGYAGQQARAIQKTLMAPIKVGGHNVYTVASIGVASYHYHNNNSHMLSSASRAVIRAKELGGARIEFFDETQNTHMSAVWRTESELQKAHDEGQLEVVCLPLKAAREGQQHAVEATLVWHHPRRGTICGEDIYKLIEDPELIRSLGKYTLNQICAPASPIAAHTLPTERLTVYIHGMGEAILKADLTDHAIHSLAQCRADSVDFVIEIDERLLNNTPQPALQNLQRLAQHQFSVAATGLSIATAHTDRLRMPFIGAVKFDVSDAAAADIASYKAATAFYQSLNITVLADGVDSQAVEQAIKDIPFDYLQGQIVTAANDS